MPTCPIGGGTRKGYIHSQYTGARTATEVLRRDERARRGATRSTGVRTANQTQVQSIKTNMAQLAQENYPQTKVKTEPGIMKISNPNQRSTRGQRPPQQQRNGQNQKEEACWRCGKYPFVAGHQLKCPARMQQCRSCGKNGHFEKMCRQGRRNADNKVKLLRDYDEMDPELSDEMHEEEGDREIFPSQSVFHVEPREANKRRRFRSTSSEDNMILMIENQKQEILRYWVTIYINEKPLRMLVDT